MPRPALSLVVPAHNEEKNLEPLLREIKATLPQAVLTADYEVVLVDDNSTDGTGALADRLGREDPRVRVVHRTEAPGFGMALRAGALASTGAVVVFFMGDRSDDPKDVVRMMEKIQEGYDVVYGSRFVPGGALHGYPGRKWLYNRGFNGLTRFLFGLPHKDITNAFKAYRREVLERIDLRQVESKSFDVTAELPLKAHRHGFRSVEVPVSWRNRTEGESKLHFQRTGPLYVRRLLSLLLR